MRHYSTCHNKDPFSVKILGNYKHIAHWHGSNIKREISRWEPHWIEDLHSVWIELGLKLFLSIT